MKQVIAVDGGGTKTEILLCQENGEVLSRVLTAATNPNDIGIGASAERLTDAVRRISRETESPVEALFSGIAGAGNFGRELTEALQNAFPDLKTVVGTDAVNLLSGEIPEGDGACIISGTGSVCYVRKDGEILRIGGWGYLLDRAGSGYDIGRDALLRALMAHDGRLPETALSGMLEARFGKPVSESLSEIYRGGKPLIASLAPIVLDGAENGDPDCREIVHKSLSAWGEMITSAYGILNHPFRTVLGGGIFAHYPSLAVDLAFLTDLPVELGLASAPPVYGAFVEAEKLIGVKPDRATKETFLQSYAAVTKSET